MPVRSQNLHVGSSHGRATLISYRTFEFRAIHLRQHGRHQQWAEEQKDKHLSDNKEREGTVRFSQG